MIKLRKVKLWLENLKTRQNYPINAAMDFSKKYDGFDYTINMASNFIDDYKRLMVKVLRVFGLSKRNALDAIDEMGIGNWEHLWETKDEEKKSAKDFMEDVVGEVFYCSDRWSWDRIICVNWMYLRFVDRTKKDMKN